MGVPLDNQPPPPMGSDQSSTNSNDHVIDIPIPIGKVGLVIGKGGDTIKKLQDRSGCSCRMIQEDPYAIERPLRCNGSLETIENLRKLVVNLIERRIMASDLNNPNVLAMVDGFQNQPADTAPEGMIPQASFSTKQLEVAVPRVAVGRVIGRGGDAIKRLQAETGARVQFEPEMSQDFRKAFISGTDEVVEAAHRQILATIKEAQDQQQQQQQPMSDPLDNMPLIPVDDRPLERILVPKDKAGLIIGKGWLKDATVIFYYYIKKCCCCWSVDPLFSFLFMV
eukprot:m.156271 g.156271  ORF g.156271 m.156271 type:complete len:281 (+) comp13336_c1_seq3:213-1055(+)